MTTHPTLGSDLPPQQLYLGVFTFHLVTHLLAGLEVRMGMLLRERTPLEASYEQAKKMAQPSMLAW